MKKLQLLILLAFLFTFTACSYSAPVIDKPELITLKWVMPGRGKFLDSKAIYAYVNKLIKADLPNINIDFTVINKYDYQEKLTLYLSAGEQIDIAWSNDNYLSYIREYSKNSLKILDPLLKTYGQDILNALPEETKENMKLANRFYYIPTVYSADGLIPYLKIPKALAPYINTEELLADFCEVDTLHEKPLLHLEQYLEQLSKLGLLGEGVDAIELSKALPYIGYDTIFSTYNEYGYRLNDKNCEIVEIDTTTESKLLSTYFNNWYNKKYIRRDINIVNKKHLNAPNNYCLSAAWGFWSEDGLQTVLSDDITNDYLYIQLDKYYHRSALDASGMVFIPRISAYPVEAVKLINLFFKNPALCKALTYGLDGEHYIQDGNLIRPTEKGASQYLMYPNILPSPPNPWHDVSKENVRFTEYRKSSSPLVGFRPSVSDASRSLLSFIDLRNSTDIVEVGGRFRNKQNSADILAILRKQATAYLTNRLGE